jgi:hypothetical protein
MIAMTDRNATFAAQRLAGPAVAADHAELLPWADPYIAQLSREHEAAERQADRRRGSGRVHRFDGPAYARPRNEARPPFVETPLPDQRTLRGTRALAAGR